MAATRRLARWAAAGLGTMAGTYGLMVAAAYLRYGHPHPPTPAEADPNLEAFMPSYEVAERHHVRVHAPADVTFRAATEVRLQDSAIVSAIFRARELVLGADPAAADERGLLAQTLALGWRVLYEEPGKEVVVGSVTKPWKANVTFRGVPAEEFQRFDEPDYVKIVWTLRVEALGPLETVCRTETRVATTDAAARARFRWYWARFSPGILLIRRMLLRQLKSDAEQRHAISNPTPA